MKTVDISLDLETCALCPTAAVMSIGAVAWQREKDGSPFFTYDNNGTECIDPLYQFSAHIDMRTEFLDGFTFDPKTAEWWARQSKEAKAALTDCDETPARYIEQAAEDLMQFIARVKESLDADRVCLWSQGTDFDIAILRNICYKYGISLPVCHTDFRDHRTFYYEGAALLCALTDTDFDPARAYDMVEDWQDPDGSKAHDPIYDCKRSIYSTWQMMKHLRCLKKGQANG